MQEGKPSSTALFVAKAVMYVLSDPTDHDLLGPGALSIQAEMISRVANPDRLLKLFSNPGFRRIVDALESKLYPGFGKHFVARKKRIAQFARAAVTEGAMQLVVFGAGFDILAYKLALEFPQLQCIEVDHPATQRPKRECGLGYPTNLRFVPADLAHVSLDSALKGSGSYDNDVQTFFVAEGLTMYLEDDDINALFEFVARQSGPRSQIAFTFLERGLDGKAELPEHSFLVDAFLKLVKEEFHWGINHDSVSEFLQEHHLSLVDLDDAEQLQQQTLGRRRAHSPTRLRAEYLAVAEQQLAAPAWG